MTTTLRPARPEDAPALSDLALRSKGHWPYDAAFLEACREELRVAPARCDGVHVTVAEIDGVVAGFVELAGTPPVGDLDKLYVDPAAIGHGVGSHLLAHARTAAGELGFETLSIDADPHAEAFYLHAGAVRTGEVPSGSIPGRMLPQLTLDLDAARVTRTGRESGLDHSHCG